MSLLIQMYLLTVNEQRRAHLKDSVLYVVQVPLEGHVRIKDLQEIIYLLADSKEICGETTDTLQT